MFEFLASPGPATTDLARGRLSPARSHPLHWNRETAI